MNGDESPDLLQYQKSSPAFPQEPTSELVFSPAQVESYRSLGFHIGNELCDWFQITPVRGTAAPADHTSKEHTSSSESVEEVEDIGQYDGRLSAATIIKAFEDEYIAQSSKEESRNSGEPSTTFRCGLFNSNGATEPGLGQFIRCPLFDSGETQPAKVVGQPGQRRT